MCKRTIYGWAPRFCLLDIAVSAGGGGANAKRAGYRCARAVVGCQHAYILAILLVVKWRSMQPDECFQNQTDAFSVAETAMRHCYEHEANLATNYDADSI